ncbi:MAG: HAD family phosphatase [Oscillospiraceae bacterium]|nr:HAD family phosphatase [Oscillospiraceae bacterium]
MKNIKLIVTDLDGTLFTTDKRLPPDFDRVLADLKTKGIVFAVATGRNFAGISHYFTDKIDEMYFICDNGAFIMEHNKLIRCVTIDRELCHRVFNTVKEYGRIDVLACGLKDSYYTRCCPDMQYTMDNYYAPVTFVEDMCDIDDELFKISYSDFNGGPIASGSYDFMEEHFGRELSISPSGGIWMDSMNKTVNKGTGVAALQEILGVSPAETLIFGDYYNDIPMLESAENIFVMAGAPDDVKKYATKIVKSNDEYGVTEAIKEFVLK